MLSKETQLSVYRTIFKPILTYGQETWIPSERTRSRIQAIEMRFLRRILNITRRDRIRNAIVREQLGVESLILSVERTQRVLVWTCPQDAN